MGELIPHWSMSWVKVVSLVVESGWYLSLGQGFALQIKRYGFIGGLYLLSPGLVIPGCLVKVRGVSGCWRALYLSARIRAESGKVTHNTELGWHF